jgi:hypothetical protein
MSLKSIILPDFVIAELYSNSLVDTGTGSVPATAPQSVQNAVPVEPFATEDQPFRYLGKNKRRISVLARYPDDPYIPEDHLQFLIKILSACKLDLGDVAIINLSVAPVSIDKLKAQLDPLAVLLFDIQPGEILLPLNFPVLKPQAFSGTNYLCIPPVTLLLEENEKAKNLKKQLWECLKKMFLA